MVKALSVSGCRGGILDLRIKKSIAVEIFLKKRVYPLMSIEIDGEFRKKT